MAGKFRSSSPACVVANENLEGDPVETPKVPPEMAAACDRMGCGIPVLNGGHRKYGCLGQTKNSWGKVKM